MHARVHKDDGNETEAKMSEGWTKTDREKGWTRARESERTTERPSEREREKRRGTKPESTKLETHYEFAPPMLFDEPPTNRILAYRNRACTVNLGIASKYSRSPIATVWRLDVLLRRWVGVSGSVCGGRGGAQRGGVQYGFSFTDGRRTSPRTVPFQ